MMWWIVLAVVVLLVAGLVMRQRKSGRRVDMDQVDRSSRKDESPGSMPGFGG